MTRLPAFTIALLLCSVLLPAPAAAQSFTTHLFGSGGTYRDEYTYQTNRWEGGRPVTETRHRNFGAGLAGGGIEWVTASGLGLLAEASLIAVEAYPNGVLTGNLVYRFRDRAKGAAIVPFVTGGYTRYGNMNGMNAGAGLNWWFSERAGLRLEARVSRVTEVREFSPTEHNRLYEARVGVVFGRR